MTDLLTIEATLKFAAGDTRVTVTIRPGDEGEIAKHGWLSAADTPAVYSEGGGLRRIGGSPGELPSVAQAKETLRFVHTVIPALLALAQWHPMIWMCSLQHASHYERLLKGMGEFRILRGSLREGNPYPLLSHYGMNGGSDDEHIVMLTPGVTS